MWSFWVGWKKEGARKGKKKIHEQIHRRVEGFLTMCMCACVRACVLSVTSIQCVKGLQKGKEGGGGGGDQQGCREDQTERPGSFLRLTTILCTKYLPAWWCGWISDANLCAAQHGFMQVLTSLFSFTYPLLESTGGRSDPGLVPRSRVLKVAGYPAPSDEGLVVGTFSYCIMFTLT